MLLKINSIFSIYEIFEKKCNAPFVIYSYYIYYYYVVGKRGVTTDLEISLVHELLVTPLSLLIMCGW